MPIIPGSRSRKKTLLAHRDRHGVRLRDGLRRQGGDRLHLHGRLLRQVLPRASPRHPVVDQVDALHDQERRGNALHRMPSPGRRHRVLHRKGAPRRSRMSTASISRIPRRSTGRRRATWRRPCTSPTNRPASAATQILFSAKLTKKGSDAHLHYQRMKGKLLCINCHLNSWSLQRKEARGIQGGDRRRLRPDRLPGQPRRVSKLHRNPPRIGCQVRDGGGEGRHVCPREPGLRALPEPGRRPAASSGVGLLLDRQDRGEMAGVGSLLRAAGSAREE